ncbi:MAG: hypothetical protein AB7O66_02770, partial [Limisphaerales bacterium]
SLMVGESGAWAGAIGFEDLGIRETFVRRCGDSDERGPAEGYLRMVLREAGEEGVLGGEDARNLYLLANAGPAHFGFPLIAWIRSDVRKVGEFVRGKHSATWVGTDSSELGDPPDGAVGSGPVISTERRRGDLDWGPMDGGTSGGEDQVSWDWDEVRKNDPNPLPGAWFGAIGGDALGDPPRGFVPSAVPDAGGTLQLLSLGLAALAGIGWVRCRGEYVPR